MPTSCSDICRRCSGWVAICRSIASCRARRSEKIASALKLSLVDAALGIYDIVNENMTVPCDSCPSSRATTPGTTR